MTLTNINFSVKTGTHEEERSGTGLSTSSEVPGEIQRQMGLTDGLTRFSVGLDNDIKRTFDKMAPCLRKAGVL